MTITVSRPVTSTTRSATDCAPAQTETFRWSPDGELLDASNPGLGIRTARHYNPLGQLRLERHSPNGECWLAEYRYDPLSRRISKQVQYTDAHGEPHPTQTTCYGWDGDQQSADAWQDDNGQWQVRTTLYEPGSFIPLLRIDQSNLTSDPILLELKRQLADAGEPVPEELRHALTEDAGDCRYASYHTDHLGTPLALTDEQGHTLWEASPDDWAAVSNEQGNTDQPLRFQGQYQDEESGLYYNRHRYYDPQLGRYVNQDPIGLLGGINSYIYGNGDPNHHIDPLGLFDVYATKLAEDEYVYKFDFSPNRFVGMVNQYQPFSPSKKVNRLRKVCEHAGLGCGENGPAGISDVEGISNKWSCLQYEDTLRENFNKLGYRDGRFSGTQLSEEQARSAIAHMTDVLPVEVSEIYDMGSVIDRAKNRAVEAFGSR